MSDYLFAQPSFWSGFGRTLDLGGAFDEYNESETAAEADAMALYIDVRAVGDAMRSAAKEIIEQSRSIDFCA